MMLELLPVMIEIYKVIFITHSIVSGDLYIHTVCLSLPDCLYLRHVHMEISGSCKLFKCL